MLKKLRRRIVCMLMAVVILIMAAVVAGVYLVTREQAANKQLKDLQRVSQIPLKQDLRTDDAPDNSKTSSSTPFFSVRLDENGECLAFISRNYTIDEQTAVILARRASNGKWISGALRSHSLRYLIQDKKSGRVRVTFVSTAEGEEQLQSLLINAIVICFIIAIGVLFLVMFPLAKWLTNPVEETWFKQKRFIADASHELKTPLTVILANLSILKNQCREKEQRPWIESSSEEADRMKALIDEMLCLARAEDAQTAFHPANAPVSDMLEQLAMIMEPVAFENGAVLSSDIEEGLHLRCDAEQLRHAIQILLENAVKYAGRGKRIRLNAKQDRKTVLISVYNDGEMIPSEALPCLFERFYRADATRAGGGYGLGLAIAKQIVELHRGKIEVRSLEGEGTTFAVRLPTDA